MPNGFHGSDRDWKALEAPLLKIDDRLADFARQFNLGESRNYHNWPERSLVWHVGKVRKLIQIFLKNENAGTFTLWICASTDRDGQRLWKQKTLKEAGPLAEIEDQLESLLVEGKLTLDGWDEQQLEIATTPRQ